MKDYSWNFKKRYKIDLSICLIILFVYMLFVLLPIMTSLTKEDGIFQNIQIGNVIVIVILIWIFPIVDLIFIYVKTYPLINIKKGKYLLKEFDINKTSLILNRRVRKITIYYYVDEEKKRQRYVESFVPLDFTYKDYLLNKGKIGKKIGLIIIGNKEYLDYIEF